MIWGYWKPASVLLVLSRDDISNLQAGFSHHSKGLCLAWNPIKLKMMPLHRYCIIAKCGRVNSLYVDSRAQWFLSWNVILCLHFSLSKIPVARSAWESRVWNQGVRGWNEVWYLWIFWDPVFYHIESSHDCSERPINFRVAVVGWEKKET